MSDQTALILVMDDDPLVRTSLDSLLRSVGLKTELFSSAREAFASGSLANAACVISDIRMPEIGGFEFQAAMAARSLEVPIIFMTGHGDIPMGVRAMKAGAVDFLPKPFRDQDMLDAVNVALERWRSMRAKGDGVAAARERYELLTPREREVMAGVVRGLLNKQVAGELGIAEITVKLHRSSLMKKMGVRRLPELVRLADTLAIMPAAPPTSV